MDHEINKISKITGELINYCLFNSSDKLDICIENKIDRCEIILKSNKTTFTKEKVDYIDGLLNSGREIEVGEYYWQLTGEDNEHELSLVGMMIDKAIIKWDDPAIEIKLIRYK